MGRYYEGDINGKFWFGVQSSNDADFFGSEGYQPFLEYYFDKENLNDINEGIKTCKKQLKGYNKKLDDFFGSVNGYNDEMLTEALQCHQDKARDLLVWYARLRLGLKIQKCVKKQGDCSFQAEI